MSRFNLLQKVADGAAVDLFLGDDKKTGERVILEIERSDLNLEDRLRERLLAEAASRQSLEHPALVHRDRADETPRGRHFWLSEPMRGETLRQFLEAKGPLAPTQALGVVRVLCEALGYLHERGLTHGALTPDYVVLETSGVRVRPKLVDSGLVLFRVPQVLERSKLIVPSDYLAPERIRGQRAGESSDIYALGILLHELLTGAAPYADEDLEATRLKHLRAPLPRLEARFELLEPIIHGCLAKDPKDRFPSARDLSLAVARSLQASETHAGTRSRPRAAAPAATPPTAFGNYRVVSRLGEGATGVVYLARHETIERQVAIKVLRPEHAHNREMVARFFQEAQLASKAKHPNVAEIYDVVDERTSGAGTRCYMVIEYVEGTTLGAALAEKPFSRRRIYQVLEQVCAALEAAHAIGVVHRDLKPENIFLARRTGEVEQVKLVDFGVAKLCRTEEDAPALTAQGQVIGTPAYMAPEQLSGKAVDARADIYSLGTVLYFLLAGKRPFTGRTLMELLMRVAREPPPYLGDVSVAGEPVTADQRRVVMRCLEKDPDKRPQTVGELRTLLSVFDVDGESAEAKPSAPVPLVRPKRRRTDAAGHVSLSGGDAFDGQPDDPIELVDKNEPIIPLARRASDVGAVAISGVVHLSVRFAAKRDLPKSAEAFGSRLAIRVPVDRLVPVGTSVSLTVSFGDDERTITLRGAIASEQSDPLAVVVQFQGDEKRRAAGLIALCAGRPPVQGTANSERVHTNLRCKLAGGAARAEGAVRDLSFSGAFVTADELSWVRPGASVRLSVGDKKFPLGKSRPWWDAVVIWHGQKYGEPGYGIKFTGAREDRARDIEAILGEAGR